MRSAALAAVLLALLLTATLFIPETQSTTRTAHFDADIEEVWEVYTDFSSQPAWRDEVVSVEFNDAQSWVETLDRVQVHLSVLDAQPPQRLTLSTASPGSFEGQYTAIFESTATGTRGVFTETSTALGYLPKVMRFLWVDQAGIIDKYSEDARAEIIRRQTLHSN